MGTLFRKLRGLLVGVRAKDEIQRELELHIEMETEDRVRRGMTRDEARRTALRDFGGVSRIREEVHDVRGLSTWDSLGQDLRFAVRTLRRAPGYTAATIVTLALGIGANTALFSVVNDVLLRPLPYAEGDRLVRIVHTADRPVPSELQLSVNERLDYDRDLASIESVVEYHGMTFVLLNRGEPDEVATGVVSSNYFGVLGVRPILGRDFQGTDDDLGAQPVLLLSHGYWQSKFGGDPAVVGSAVEMNDMMHTIIGVLPPIPAYPEPRDVYMPTAACPMRAMAEHDLAADRRTFPVLLVFGRLVDGVSVEGAAAEVATLGRRFATEFPSAYRVAQTGFQSGVVGLNDEMIVEAQPILLGLLAATGLVLVIACANVANLTLARVLKRQRELALRTALGAGRWRLVRQLLTESALTSLAGASLGLAVAWVTKDSLAAFASRFTPRVITPSLDLTVLIFTVALALATSVIFATLPALGGRLSMLPSLKDGAAQSGDSVRGRNLRALLVVSQVAVCFALLVGAGLFLQSLRRLTNVDLGYDATQVLTARIPGSWSHTRMPAPGEVERFYRAIADRLEASPDVALVAFTNAVPLSDSEPLPRPIAIDGIAAADASDLPLADRNVVSERYFDVLNVPILRGRAFTAGDDADAARVAIINMAMAKLWGDRDPLGSRFTVNGTTYTVVGLVGDMREVNVEQQALAQFYTPFLQARGGATQVLLRARNDPATLLPALKDAVYAADPTAPIERVERLDALVAGRLASPRLNALLLAIFAGLALFITVAGLGAAIATSVSQRTREFGLRMALGSSRGSVLRMVLAQGLTLVVAGLAIGALAAAALSRGIASRLYETTPLEPVVYLGVASLFLACALIACAGPARRATSVDPLTALRAD